MFESFHIKHRIYDAIAENMKVRSTGEQGTTVTEELPEDSITDDMFTFAELNETEAERMVFENYSYWRSTFQVFLKKKTTVAILAVLAALILFCLIQPYLPGQKDPTMININPATGIQYSNVAPGRDFWFGTNDIGQDLWSRIWSGTRTSLFVGFVTAIISSAIGITLGCIWGYARKWDKFFTEVYNVFDNVPYTVLRTLITYIMSPSLFTMIFVMCLTGWIGITRMIRNMILIYRDREYNLASRCYGTPGHKIILKNILPQLISVIMLETALAVPQAIGTEVYLTYIGLGLPLSIPSLGNLVNEGRAVMLVPAMRYQLYFPVIVVSIITIAFYALGNSFADASDPKNHR